MGPCMLVINEVSLRFEICSVSQNPIRSLRRSHDFLASLSSSPTQGGLTGAVNEVGALTATHFPEDRELQRKVLRWGVLSHAMLYAMAQSRGLEQGALEEVQPHRSPAVPSV